MNTNIKCCLPCKRIFPEGFCGEYRARIKHSGDGMTVVTDKVQCVDFKGDKCEKD